MNLLPLSELKFSSIAKSIEYSGNKMRTKTLYEQLQNQPIPLEDKVKFILRHWGWGNFSSKKANEKIAEIELSGFVIPQNVKELLMQFYGLRVPVKTKDPYDKYGGIVIFEIPKKWESMISSTELLCVHYDDDIMPIGYMLNYNGASNQKIDGWEDPQYQSCGYEYYDLYLGSSGQVYFQFVDGDCIGIKGESLVDFFAKSFGLITFKEDVIEELNNDDFDLLEQIDELYDQGTYKQNCFRK